MLITSCVIDDRWIDQPPKLPAGWCHTSITAVYCLLRGLSVGNTFPPAYSMPDILPIDDVAVRLERPKVLPCLAGVTVMDDVIRGNPESKPPGCNGLVEIHAIESDNMVDDMCVRV